MSTLVQKCVLSWKPRCKTFDLVLDTAGLCLYAIPVSSTLLHASGDGATGRQRLQGRRDRVIFPLKVWGTHFTVSTISLATRRDSHALAAVTLLSIPGEGRVSSDPWRLPYRDLSSPPLQLYSLSPAFLITSSDVRCLARIYKGTFDSPFLRVVHTWSIVV